MVDRSIAQIAFNSLNLCDYSYNYSVSGVGNESNILVRTEVMVLEKGNVINTNNIIIATYIIYSCDHYYLMCLSLDSFHKIRLISF